MNFSDPFGLCAGESTKQEKANRTQSNTEQCTGGVVTYKGISVSLVIGPIRHEFAIGKYSDEHGTGSYKRVGKPKGVDIGISIEFGHSQSKEAFIGGSSGGCIGYLLAGICTSTNQSGVTAGGQLGVSIGKTTYTNGDSNTELGEQKLDNGAKSP